MLGARHGRAIGALTGNWSQENRPSVSCVHGRARRQADHGKLGLSVCLTLDASFDPLAHQVALPVNDPVDERVGRRLTILVAAGWARSGPQRPHESLTLSPATIASVVVDLIDCRIGSPRDPSTSAMLRTRCRGAGRCRANADLDRAKAPSWRSSAERQRPVRELVTRRALQGNATAESACRPSSSFRDHASRAPHLERVRWLLAALSSSSCTPARRDRGGRSCQRPLWKNQAFAARWAQP